MDAPFNSAEIFRALGAWASANPRGLRTGGGPEGFDHVQFHHRPDPQGPEVQVTLRAALVEGRPVIIVEAPPPADRRPAPGEAVTVVRMEGASPSAARDPEARCEGCGAVGTVGRAARTDPRGVVTEEHRFCLACWPEQSARYRARWEDEDRRRGDAFLRGRDRTATGPGPGMQFQAATWHNALDLVRKLERSMTEPVPAAPADLARVAAQIRAVAPELEGEMPFAVEAFLRRYGAPGA